mgnify:CR=1 FL=1
MSMFIQEILQESSYGLEQFETENRNKYIKDLEKTIVKSNGSYKIKCLIRDKDIKLTPEEIVRQLYLRVLLKEYKYPKELVRVEYPVAMGSDTKKADICILDKIDNTSPYIIIEVKKPKFKEGKEQLKSYCNATGALMGVWTNGCKVEHYHRKDPNYFESICSIPKSNEKLMDVLNEQWTYADLMENDKLKKEKKSLKEIILDMEDEVLANAGVDVFEEVFKLILAKLYDEKQGYDYPKELLRFKNRGETDQELKEKIQVLFNDAMEEWKGVFSEGAEIQLTPTHLAICVSSLESIKLFNSNLDVIDDAFEYLINKSSKGEKGQYFTPRYVIDMCVKMLNPSETENLIDPASGSCGFPMHAVFHVWDKIDDELGITEDHKFTARNRSPRHNDYVRKKIFAIDFDDKAVRVARALNLIAGDGQSNVLKLNTLDYKGWEIENTDKKSKGSTQEQSWIDTYNEGFKKFKSIRASKDGFRDFNFDIVMANPPFAGDIKETKILSNYELSKNSKGKFQTKVGRDILFIERCLQFLKPGGRMAIVLPQGRFNNSSDKYIRDFIVERCRILAVVGLHGNVFKPHTGTKTSVLFVQKWDNKLCPKREDYPIFFATMQEPSKDSSGDKIYVKDTEGKNKLDSHKHLIVKHDLFNHAGLTQDGIAEAFIEFAKKEKLSFFQ